jgi:hypothetical protein
VGIQSFREDREVIAALVRAVAGGYMIDIVTSYEEALIPDWLGRGPVTRSRMRRSGLLYALLALAGLAPYFLSWSPAWQAAGIGLWFPGAGFIASSGWSLLLLPLTVALFAAALFAWFGSGNIVAPFVIWLGSAAVAGLVAGNHVPIYAPYVVVALTLIFFITQSGKARRAHAAEVRKREERNSYLPAAVAASRERMQAAPALQDRELSPHELKAVRFLLNRSLQPLGSFKGFDKIDQFQTAATRYQLNYLGYALAALQCNYMPNFHGYLSQAQRRLIEQCLLPQVWSYWRLERLWGHLATTFDPVGKDNIMLTGFFGLQVGVYTSTTGDRRYAQPGSLTFDDRKGHCFVHDLHSINRSLVDNMQTSAYCLYPCEPNWIYVGCNVFGFSSLSLYDRVFGKSDAARLKHSFVSGLGKEFTLQGGDLVAIRSSLTGLTIPNFVGVMSDAGTAYMASPVFPRLAERIWAKMRTETVKLKDGNLEMKLVGADLIDIGNYKKRPASALAMLAMGAREQGEEAIAEAAFRRIREEFKTVEEDGGLFYEGMSNNMNTMVAEAEYLRRGDWRRTVMEGPPPSALTGPLLADANYPEVLVAKAVSGGEDLSLVLYPGEQPGVYPLGLERLIPGRNYRTRGCTTESVVADAQGHARVQVDLQGRTELRIEPIVGQ